MGLRILGRIDSRLGYFPQLCKPPSRVVFHFEVRALVELLADPPAANKMRLAVFMDYKARQAQNAAPIRRGRVRAEVLCKRAQFFFRLIRRDSLHSPGTMV